MGGEIFAVITYGIILLLLSIVAIGFFFLPFHVSKMRYDLSDIKDNLELILNALDEIKTLLEDKKDPNDEP